MKRKKVFVTGGSGFFGKILIEKIARNNISITTTVNKNTDLPKNIKTLELKSDVRKTLSDFFIENEVDVIIHLAGRINGTSQSIKDSNEILTKHLVNAANSSSNTPKLIFLSSVSAINKLGEYGKSKDQAEKLIKKDFNGDWTILRSSLIYGPGDEKNIGTLIKAAKKWPLIPALGGDNVKLQPLYALDLANLIDELIFEMNDLNSTWIVAGPEQIGVSEIIKTIQKCIKRERFIIQIPLRPVQIFARFFRTILHSLNLPLQQISGLSKHPKYESDAALKNTSFKPRSLNEGLKDFLY